MKILTRFGAVTLGVSMAALSITAQADGKFYEDLEMTSVGQQAKLSLKNCAIGDTFYTQTLSGAKYDGDTFVGGTTVVSEQAVTVSSLPATITLTAPDHYGLYEVKAGCSSDPNTPKLDSSYSWLVEASPIVLPEGWTPAQPVEIVSSGFAPGEVITIRVFSTDGGDTGFPLWWEKKLGAADENGVFKASTLIFPEISETNNYFVVLEGSQGHFSAATYFDYAAPAKATPSPSASATKPAKKAPGKIGLPKTGD